MQRRSFIRSGIIATTVALLPSRQLFAGVDSPVVYEATGDPAKAISSIFAMLGGIKTLVKKDISKAVILLKPNLCLPHKDSSATITSIDLIKATTEYLLSEGAARVIIADHTLQTTEQFATLDISAYAKSNSKITLLLANEQKHYETRTLEGEVLKTAEFLKILNKVDYFINMPTAKHHTATNVSLSLKNLMGVIWDRQVFHSQIDLHQGIADLAKAIRPDLNILDASRVLLNRGPVGPGPVEKPNKIFASKDILALDSIVASRFNFGGRSVSAKEITHLWAAYKTGIGEINPEKINLVQL